MLPEFKRHQPILFGIFLTFVTVGENLISATKEVIESWCVQSCYTMNWGKCTEYIVDRGIVSHISNMNIQFWASLGSRGCREKFQTLQICYFWSQFFMFFWPKLFF